MCVCVCVCVCHWVYAALKKGRVKGESGKMGVHCQDWDPFLISIWSMILHHIFHVVD